MKERSKTRKFKVDAGSKWWRWADSTRDEFPKEPAEAPANLPEAANDCLSNEMAEKAKKQTL